MHCVDYGLVFSIQRLTSEYVFSLQLKVELPVALNTFFSILEEQ